MLQILVLVLLAAVKVNGRSYGYEDNADLLGINVYLASVQLTVIRSFEASMTIYLLIYCLLTVISGTLVLSLQDYSRGCKNTKHLV